jgi:predicted nucleotidyltransferase component of viral defense system
LADLAREAERFGVSDEQVRRDHAISHVLAAISERRADDVIFFGGTALSRTHLVHARLSEDIDLIALGPRAEVADRLTRTVNGGLLRTHGRLS